MSETPRKGVWYWSVRLCVVGTLIALLTVGWALQYFHSAGPLTEQHRVIIPKGTGFDEIALILEKEGVLKFPRLFELMVLLSGNGRNFHAGEYMFPAGVTPETVMDALLEGKTVVHRVTIPEGFTTYEIVTLLQAIPDLDGVVPPGIPEGKLLPETYHFSYGDLRQDMVARMQRDMEEVLNNLWEKRAKDLPFSTKEEAVTLASIVEKETGLSGERGRVAAVFINRMRKGMKLQSDPTAIYGITLGKDKLGRMPSGKDMTTDTAYNTYVIAGLPPGPICNPGKDALKAVLNPPSTNELYFVAMGGGGHNFSSTLKEHNANVAKYRAWQKAQPKTKP